MPPKMLWRKTGFVPLALVFSPHEMDRQVELLLGHQRLVGVLGEYPLHHIGGRADLLLIFVIQVLPPPLSL